MFVLKLTNLCDTHKGWNTPEHLDLFNTWNQRNFLDFSKTYGSFEENKYLVEAIQEYQKTSNRIPSILDVGCATGTTLRYLKQIFKTKDINYLGLDVSSTAIKEAQRLHGNYFKHVDQDWAQNIEKFNVVYSRDTVMHQEDPYSYLNNLLNISEEYLILRLRTRDSGKTDFDINTNCQAHYSEFWMPYIVLNIDELCEFLKSKHCIKEATINRSYDILGGYNRRFLPKELYFSDAGGSETSILIKLDRKNKTDNINFNLTFNLEGHNYIKSNLSYFRALKILSKISNLFK